jgi:vacuolar-type H+-ATPase subunit I/STV1
MTKPSASEIKDALRELFRLSARNAGVKEEDFEAFLDDWREILKKDSEIHDLMKALEQKYGVNLEDFSPANIDASGGG